jgi:hypothetical protein
MVFERVRALGSEFSASGTKRRSVSTGLERQFDVISASSLRRTMLVDVCSATLFADNMRL